MLFGVVHQMAVLAQGREIFVAIVAGNVVEMRDGQNNFNDAGRAADRRARVVCNRHDFVKLAAAHVVPGSALPARAHRLQNAKRQAPEHISRPAVRSDGNAATGFYNGAVRFPAILAPVPGSSEYKRPGDGSPLNAVELSELRPDRHGIHHPDPA